MSFIPDWPGVYIAQGLQSKKILLKFPNICTTVNHFRNVSKLASYYTTLQFVNNLVSREMANLIEGNCRSSCLLRQKMTSSCLQLQCLCLQAPQHFPPIYLPAGNIENSSFFFFSLCQRNFLVLGVNFTFICVVFFFVALAVLEFTLDQSGLKLRELPASASCVLLGLKVCASTFPDSALLETFSSCTLSCTFQSLFCYCSSATLSVPGCHGGQALNTDLFFHCHTAI